MSQGTQGDGSYTQVALPVKRGRGRPRKDPSLKRVRTVLLPAPPGFAQIKETQTQQVDTINDGMIGQAVTGIVESAFDAGYLLSVRIGNSNTTFRGVVFKPGKFDPVTTANDVAPHVQMIKRNEIQLPANNNQVQVHGHNSSEKRAQLNVPPTTTALSVPSMGARGSTLPVMLLQPVNLTNRLPPPTQAPLVSSKAAHMVAAKEKGMAINQEPPVSRQGGDVGEGKSFDATERIQVSPLSQNANSQKYEASHKLSAGNSSVVLERDIGDMNVLPSVEPSETVKSPVPNQATSVSKPLMNYGIGRMTELLQAVQENMVENSVLRAGESADSLG